MNLTPDELVAIHAEQRAKERYGVELTDVDRMDMVSQVKDGRGLFFKKKDGSSKVSIWLVWWSAASRIVPIYYKAGRVLTVLPTEAFFGPTPAPPPISNVLVFPRELTDDLRNILSMMMWNTGPIAHALRAGGVEIKTRAEDEQAHVMHWLITLALEHGSTWREKASDRIHEIRAALAATEGSK